LTAFVEIKKRTGMSLFRSVMEELEAALKSGTPGKRTEVLREVTGLFANGAEKVSEQQVAVFDDVMNYLITHIEKQALIELSAGLAQAKNVPRGVIWRLASDDAIEIAGPMLENSQGLTDDDLVEIAKTKSQAHQIKIAARPRLNTLVTEVLIDRCDGEIANMLAANKGARFSNGGFSKLVMMADGDDHLTTILAGRPDIPPRLFRELLARATATVRQTLLTSAPPEAREGLQKILTSISGQIGAGVTSRHYEEAQRLINTFSQDTQLTRQKVLEFAKSKRIEETVATMAALSAVPIELVDRLMYNTSPYGIVILCKVTALYWNVASAVMRLRPWSEGEIPYDVDDLYEDYEDLSASVAQRLLRFWQSRQAAPEAEVVQAITPAAPDLHLLPV
jgi:uncharacterized protein (DUF2336 family)